MALQEVNRNQQGNPAKRRNHTVPKALLKRWLSQHEGSKGYWTLDCASGDIRFEQGEKASFAISDYRYVPVRTTEGRAPYRDEAVEDWFSKGENDLAFVTDLVLEKKPLGSFGKKILGFTEAAILLGFRSAYEYEMLERVITDPGSALSQDDISRYVIDYFQKAYKYKLRQFANWDWQIIPAKDEDLLVCDRPLFDMTVNRLQEELLAIPLAPRLMLVAVPPKDRHRTISSLTVADVTTSKIISLANNFTVQRARQFVVAASFEQLEQLKAEFSSEAFQARKATDRIVIQGPGFQEGVLISTL
ncbi:DUF4238 domain-containing protein [Comamonas thiooxydans]|uniref:DUF4238 domain-containing protein n=1 Tax=Comamonas thiooxydans TaxID=363952 RepID=UPI0015A73940|nr:DUF4238 domain-containing protein [Comamonas thiooxydans]